MSILIVGSLAAAVAMMANNNEDSPVLWGILTFIAGVIGTSVFGMLGALIGSSLAAGVYAVKALKFG